MHFSAYTLLSALCIASPISASLSTSKPQALTTRGATLKPIAIRDYEAAAGLQRRASSEDFSDLDTQTQAELIYGSPGDDGQLLLANMTLYAEDGLELVLMERFDGLTSAVDCNGDDGSMSLMFSSQGAFKYALSQWTYINKSDNGTFILIANHDGCGPDGERQPYFITKVTEDNATLTTYLTAKPAAWEDVSGTFDLDFGQVTPYQNAKRGLGDDILGNFNESSKPLTFGVNAGTKGQVSSIYSDSKFSLDCVNCFTSGSFTLTGHISTHHWSITALTLVANPQDFQAELELEAKVTAGTSPAKLQYEKELVPPIEIPGAGFSIGKIFSLGATLSYDVGITSTFQGTADVDFGVSAGLPNTAQLTADLQDFGSSSATGFGGGDLTPIFNVKDMSASITLGAYSKPKISFGIQIIKIGTAEVDIGVKLPEVDVTLTADYNEAGVCTGNPSKTGIELNSTLDIEVDLDLTAKFGSSDTPSWSKPIFTFTEPIGSKCFPINIPGLSPSSTAIPSLTATATTQSQSASGTQTHVYSASGVSVMPIVNGSSYIIAPSGASIPYSATALKNNTASATGTGYIVGPSGISASGTGRMPGYSGNPPYPYSTGPSGGARATGTGASSGFASASASASSGFLSHSRPSGTAVRTGSLPSSSVKASASGTVSTSSRAASGTGSGPSKTTSPGTATSGISTGAVPSGTGAIHRRQEESNFKSPPIPRAARGRRDGGW